MASEEEGFLDMKSEEKNYVIAINRIKLSNEAHLHISIWKFIIAVYKFHQSHSLAWKITTPLYRVAQKECNDFDP